jgi:thiamine-monophosphate kinase
MSEFSLIEKFFRQPAHKNEAVRVGIGDDAAVLAFPEDQQLVVCVDTLVQGTHFLPNTPPEALGHQALAVNLSDMAAMGATPCWFTLALTMPEENDTWLAAFSQGLLTLADVYKMSLIGGDTTQGPLAITVQVLGIVPPGLAILRSGAKTGDKIYVTGHLGDAALGLAMLENRVTIAADQRAYLQQRYQRPDARVEVGEQLRDLATSAIDISDGLAADLSHILTESRAAAIIYAKDLPLSAELKNSVPISQALMLALTGGGDYELCFTVPATRHVEVEQIIKTCQVPCTCIGEITASGGLQIIGLDEKPLHLNKLGWEHFL